MFFCNVNVRFIVLKELFSEIEFYGIHIVFLKKTKGICRLYFEYDEYLWNSSFILSFIDNCFVSLW